MKPENKVYRLPDYYDKEKGNSNNWKILELGRAGAEELNGEIEAVRDASDVSKATGAGLDVWGDIEDIDRNGLPDETYRIQIQLQMLRDMINPDYASVYSAILSTFNRTKDDIVFSRTENPYEYRFDKFPLSAVTEAGLDINEATELIEDILPITGELQEIQYESANIRFPVSVAAVATVYPKYCLSNDVESTEEMYIAPNVLVAAVCEISVWCGYDI